jgi:hypothetical protein
MTHPTESDLALFAGRDVALAERVRIAWHVRRCSRCREDVDALRETSAALREDLSYVPPSVDWDRLAAEMTANIHLGLEAGECVAQPKPRPVSLQWRVAAALASVTIVIAGAWWLNPPVRQSPEMRAPRVEIRTTSAGLELNENGNSLVLLHGRGTQVQRAIIVSAPGSLRARYVDTDTGQITINNVYVE